MVAIYFFEFYTKINVISYNFEPIIKFVYFLIKKIPRNSWIIAVSNLKYQTNLKNMNFWGQTIFLIKTTFYFTILLNFYRLLTQ